AKGKEQEDRRTYFLRDLFVEKIFNEQGLVTKASDVNAAHRRKRALLLTSGIAASLLLIIATVLSFFMLQDRILNASKFWTKVYNDGVFDPDKWAIVQPGKPDPYLGDNNAPNVEMLEVEALTTSKE